jgi:hypothetical protein
MRRLNKRYRVTDPDDTTAKSLCKNTSAPSKLRLETRSNFIQSIARGTELRDFKDSLSTDLHPLTLSETRESDSAGRDILLHLTGTELEVCQSFLFDEKNLTSALHNGVPITTESQPFDDFCVFNEHHWLSPLNAELKRDDCTPLILHSTIEEILDS